MAEMLGRRKEDRRREDKRDRRGKGLLRVHVLLDESGSMGSIKESTIDSVNEYLSSIEGVGVKTKITAFHGAGFTREMVIHEISSKRLTNRNYRPMGSTPLRDALGTVLTSTTKGKTLVVVMTDGQENSSCEFSSSQIRRLVESRKEEGWTFVYLGANQNSWESVRDFGFNKDMVYDYVGTSEGVRYAANALAGQTVNMAVGSEWDNTKLKNLTK